MKKVKNIYARIGTSPFCYLNNYLNLINHFSISKRFHYDLEKYKIFDEDYKEIKTFNSGAVIRQNIDAWSDFGFINVNRENKIITKIVNTFKNINEAIEELKLNILKDEVDQNDRHISMKNLRNNAILLRMKILNNDPKISKLKELKGGFKVFNRHDSKVFDLKTIEQDISDLERKMSEDHQFVKIINDLELEYDDKGDKNE